MTLFTTGVYRRESKRCRPNLLPIIHTYRANWEHLGEKKIITRTRAGLAIVQTIDFELNPIQFNSTQFRHS